jgi:hypothetical protein
MRIYIRALPVLTALLLSSPRLGIAQAKPADVRAHVRAAIDELTRSPGAFGGGFAAGPVLGNRTPMKALDSLVAQSPDATLTALVNCFPEVGATQLTYAGQKLSRGGVCYAVLRNLAYREVAGTWAGNITGTLTAKRLRAAELAWREAIKRHWYNVL